MVYNPLKKITVIPIADESFGVRSMCTYIETKDVKVLIDPGVSLGPRFSLLPHPVEYNALRESRKRIEEFSEKAEVLTISHYHFDHITPTFTDYTWNWSSPDAARRVYGDKLVLAKSIRSNVNPSQRRRGWILRKTTEKYVKEVKIADGKTYDFKDTHLTFSPPVFHGEAGTYLGWVLMLTVSCGEEKVMHASDVQGPITHAAMNLILEENPDLLLIGGPPAYLSGYKVSNFSIEKGINNLKVLAEKTSLIIVMHHLLRDEKWRELSKPVFEAAEKVGHKVVTAAEFVGKTEGFFEYQRSGLYEKQQPSEEFIRWTRLPRLKRKEREPPL